VSRATLASTDRATTIRVDRRWGTALMRCLLVGWITIRRAGSDRDFAWDADLARIANTISLSYADRQGGIGWKIHLSPNRTMKGTPSVSPSRDALLALS
jgi:hypothetical protein